MNRSRLLVLVLVAATAACAHVQKHQTLVTDNRQPAPVPQAKPQLVAQARLAPTPAADAEAGRKALDAALQALADTKVFFDTDEAIITPAGESALAAVGRILGQYQNLSIRVEGNCDERGTEAYNLSLGEKRAAAAKRYLVTMGATDGQIKTLSYGSERPKALGHDESAWRQNRRDDLVVIGGER